MVDFSEVFSKKIDFAAFFFYDGWRAILCLMFLPASLLGAGCASETGMGFFRG